MTEERWTPKRARTQIGQDLTAIEDAAARLLAEAYNHAQDPDIPGGSAMVMLGPRADVEAWGYVQISSIMGRLHYGRSSHANQLELDAIENQDIEPPLSFLAGWVDIIREERGQGPGEVHATLSTEIAYIRSALDWILAVDDEGNPWWLPAEDFSNQLHRVRLALDVAVGHHDQVDAGAPCLQHKRPYVKQWHPKDPSKDRWWCDAGKHSASENEYREAVKAMHLSQALALPASDIELQYRVKAATVRKWAQRERVRKRGRDRFGRLLYDVPDTLAMRDLDPGA